MGLVVNLPFIKYTQPPKLHLHLTISASSSQGLAGLSSTIFRPCLELKAIQPRQLMKLASLYRINITELVSTSLPALIHLVTLTKTPSRDHEGNDFLILPSLVNVGSEMPYGLLFHKTPGKSKFCVSK